MSHEHQPSRKEVEKFLVRIETENHHLLREMHYMLRCLTGLFRPTALHIALGDSNMPATIEVGQSIIATPIETDAAGNTLAISDPTGISWVTSDPSLTTGSGAPDGTFTFVGVAAGTVTVTVTDPANGLTGTDTLTISAVTPPPPPPDVATKLAIEWGTPVAA